LCDFVLLVILGLIRVITGVLDAVSVGLGRNSKGFSRTNFNSVVSLLQGFQGKCKLQGGGSTFYLLVRKWEIHHLRFAFQIPRICLCLMYFLCGNTPYGFTFQIPEFVVALPDAQWSKMQFS